MNLDVTFHDIRRFEKWLRSLDPTHADRVLGRLRFAARLGGPRVGMPLVRALGDSLHELRVDKYRIYFVVSGHELHIVAAGSKDTQQRDIRRARRRLQ